LIRLFEILPRPFPFSSTTAGFASDEPLVLIKTAQQITRCFAFPAGSDHREKVRISMAEVEGYEIL